MFTDFGFIAREEGDDFLILTCPGCTTDIMFTQFVDPVVIHTTVNAHVGHCGANHAQHPRQWQGGEGEPLRQTAASLILSAELSTSLTP